MSNYLKRYQKGEYEQVWLELSALGSEIRQKSLYPEVLEGVEETILRVKINIDLLVNTLETLNYIFAYKGFNTVIQPIGQSGLEDLNIVEQQTRLLPLSLRVFFEKIGTVEFTGSHPVLATDNAQDHSIFSDPLVVWADIDPDPEHYINPYFEEDNYEESMYLNPNILVSYEQTLEEQYPYKINISGDADTKAGFGGEFYSLVFPNQGIDGHLIGTKMSFIQHLRNSIRWGGFPGLATKSPVLSSELEFLTKDLLPF